MTPSKTAISFFVTKLLCNTLIRKVLTTAVICIFALLSVISTYYATCFQASVTPLEFGKLLTTVSLSETLRRGTNFYGTMCMWLQETVKRTTHQAWTVPSICDALKGTIKVHAGKGVGLMCCSFI